MFRMNVNMQNDLFNAAVSAKADQTVSQPQQARIARLVRELNQHAHAYYVMDAPTIPDASYDQLFLELQQLEQAHPEWKLPESPTARVGAAPLPEFGQVTHGTPMLSLNNGFDPEDIAAFDKRVQEGLNSMRR